MADEGGAAPPQNEPGYLINDSKVGADGKMFIGGKLFWVLKFWLETNLSQSGLRQLGS